MSKGLLRNRVYHISFLVFSHQDDTQIRIDVETEAEGALLALGLSTNGVAPRGRNCMQGNRMTVTV